MPNKVIVMLILRKLLLLVQRGLSIRAIARELEISGTTVMDYHKRMDASGKTPQELLIMEDALLSEIMRPIKQQVTDIRLEKFNALKEGYLNELAGKRVTRIILFEEYQKLYPEGYGYSKFCQLLSQENKLKKATLHNTYLPGDKMMFDFAGRKLTYVDPQSGELINTDVFIAVLPYSNFTYVEAISNATLPQVVSVLNRAIQYFGGTPACAKTDNMAQVVSKPSLYEPTITEGMDQWALHNNIAIMTARVRRPKDKAPAEGHVRIAYEQMYSRIRNDVFHSLKELNEGLRKQLDALNDRTMQAKDYSRRQRFLDMEKHLLKPLVDPPFVLKHRAQRKISLNYHFKLAEDAHQYSVPYKYIGKRLTAIYDNETVEIYDGLERILVYSRVKGHGYTTEAEHMPSNHKAYLTNKSKTSIHFLESARLIGPNAEQYIQCLLNASGYEEQAYDSCLGILRLAEKITIGHERMEFACKRGLKVGRYGYKIIARILENNQDKAEQELMDQKPKDISFTHENVRGPEAFK